MFVDIANERPYLWAIYAIIVVLPFVLCAACCVRSKPKPKDDVATRKKTDAPSPDDPHAGEGEVKEPAGGESFVAAAEDEDAEGKEPSSPPEKEDEGVQEEEGEGSQEGGASQEEGEASQEEKEASQEEREASQEEEGGASQEEGVADTKVMKLYRILCPTWLIFMCTVFMVST